MKHIQLFENFVNESKELDKKLVEIVFNFLVDNDTEFDQIFYLSAADREEIKKEYGNSLPYGFASPSKGTLSGSILSPLAGDSIYMDDTDLVKGDKTVMQIKQDTTWGDVAKALKLI